MGQPPPGPPQPFDEPPLLEDAGQPPLRTTEPRVSPPEPRPGRHRNRWWGSASVALVVYLFLWFVTLLQPVNVAGLSLSVPIPGMSSQRIFGLPDGPFTVMIVGLDARPSQIGGPARTDSILLLRVDPDRNRAGIISIPRDSMMQLPYGDGSFTNDRVNTAYVLNWSDDDPSAAPRALTETIERNLGIKVDHYVIFDQYGAKDVIDAAGGVDVKVGAAFGQDNYSDDDVNVIPQFFEEGWQHLNGYEAVAYGRIREGSSDFDRIRRQQQVAEGLVDGLSSPLSVRKYPGLWSAYEGAVETDMGLRQSAGMFLFLKRVGTDRLVTRSLGDAAVSCGYCSASILLLEPNAVASIISEAFGDEASGRQAAQLLVQAGVTP